MHYGYSVWYIPHNYNYLAQSYDMNHIPHVTYKTNIETEKECFDLVKLLPHEVTVDFVTDIVKFPKMHKNDPLFGYGWYVTAKVDMDHVHFSTDPHLTLEYFNNYNDYKNHNIVNKKKPNRLKCFLAVVDTQSNNPSDWFILLKFD